MEPPIRYYDRQKEKLELAEIAAAQKNKNAKHVDFLLQRRAERIDLEKRTRTFIPAQAVAARTREILHDKADVYFQQLLSWRPLLKLRRLDQVHVFEMRPHLGYASVTVGLTPDSKGVHFPWILCFSNFNAKFGKGQLLFENIPMNYGFTFFGLGLTFKENGSVGGRNLKIRGNGLLFATSDPGDAFENASRLCDMNKLWAGLQKFKQAH